MTAGDPSGRNVVVNALRREMQRAFPGSRSQPRSGLLMLSGGLDSVALLANVLQETDQRLHVHHIELQNYENRLEVENQALEGILAYVRDHYRPFTYSTSGSEFPLGKGGGYDLTLVLFTAARVLTALGRTVDVVWTGHVSPMRAVIVEGSAVFNACHINKRFKPVWLWPLAHLKKIDIYDSIPRELADLTWSCRRPETVDGGYAPCGRCHACRSRAEVTRILAQRDAGEAGKDRPEGGS